MENNELNYGVKVLNSILDIWKKSNDDYQSYDFDIFLPKLYIENEVNYFIFPLFEKLTNNKIRIIEWKKLNLETLRLEDTVEADFEYEITENAFSFYDENNQKLLIKFVEIYRALKKSRKGQIEYSDVLELVIDYNDSLLNLIDSSLVELYSDLENEEEIIKEENIEEEEHANGVNKQEEEHIEEYTITYEDNTEVDNPEQDSEEEYTFEETEEETVDGEYSVKTILDKVNSIEDLEEKDYDFEWNIENGLRFVSDEMIDIICEILKKGNFKIAHKEKYEFSNAVRDLCTKDITNKDLLDKLKDESIIKQKNDIYSVKNIYKYADHVCVGCKFERCPKYYTAYVLYLKNKNLLEEKLKDREDFRKNNFKSNYFTFKWEPQGIGLEHVSEEMFQYSMELAKRGRVIVSADLKKGSIKINTVDRCSTLALNNGDISKIPTEKADYRNDVFYNEKQK